MSYVLLEHLPYGHHPSCPLPCRKSLSRRRYRLHGLARHLPYRGLLRHPQYLMHHVLFLRGIQSDRCGDVAIELRPLGYHLVRRNQSSMVLKKFQARRPSQTSLNHLVHRQTMCCGLHLHASEKPRVLSCLTSSRVLSGLSCPSRHCSTYHCIRYGSR